MNVEIAERLAARRKEAGLSQEVLAERLGVSRQAVSKWERSESSPDTDNLIALAKLYGVSLDDLLYVDECIEDDIEFEAADRAAKYTGVPQPNKTEASGINGENFSPKQVPPASGAASGRAQQYAETPSAGTPSSEGSFQNSELVYVGLGGIHVKDGDDYVHVSWRDGVHVSESGDEVHVGWSGIHVNDKTYSKKSEDFWVGARDGEGDEFSWSTEGVSVNGEHFDNWKDAKEKHGNGHWLYPSGYTVKGEYFDTIGAAKAKYGSDVGKSIPVRKHYKFSAWLKFPYPLAAVVAYLLVGFTAGAWGVGLFIFLTIPLYYMIGHALLTKNYAPLLAGVYPLLSVAWFLYMAFVENAPHPAWVIFLTIPIAEWLIHSISRWWRHRKRAAAAVDVDVEQ